MTLTSKSRSEKLAQKADLNIFEEKISATLILGGNQLRGGEAIACTRSPPVNLTEYSSTIRDTLSIFTLIPKKVK
ncbi:MAG: hypothetical protein U7123_16615 [Potamolinea sp.]